MSQSTPKSEVRSLDLRSFRESLSACTLGRVARATRIDKSLLSKLETGRREITTACAKRLARFYSRIAGRSVTAGEILDMAEVALARRRTRSRSSGAMEASDVEERSVAS
jgi:plasmid maintenance system antidote protein VapI